MPDDIVISAGTGGTSSAIGRYIRCQGYDTQLMVNGIRLNTPRWFDFCQAWLPTPES